MLNDTQKALIRATLDSLLFDDIDELMQELQDMVCSAALSLPYYITVKDKLEAINVEESVRQIGEMISHPFSHHPRDHHVDSSNIALPPIQIIMRNAQNNGFEVQWIGILNLTAKNEGEQQVTALDVKEYITELLRAKIVTPVVVVPEKEKEGKRSFNPENVDEFLKCDMTDQLKYLNIFFDETMKSMLHRIDLKKIEAYKIFLGQFGISLAELSTDAELSHQMWLWAEKSSHEYSQACEYAHTDDFSFVQVVDAKLGKFDRYLSMPTCNFFGYRALMRVALQNGHNHFIPALAADSADLIFLLMNAKQQKELLMLPKDVLKKISIVHSNYLIRHYFEAGRINLKFLKRMLSHMPISQIEKTSLIEKIISAPSNEFNYHFLIELLACKSSSYTALDVVKIKEYFNMAANKSDVGAMALFLTAIPQDPLKTFLTKDLIFSLFNTPGVPRLLARKVAAKSFGSVLSEQDIRVIAKLDPKYSWTMNYSTSISAERMQPPTPTFTPRFAQSAASSSASQVADTDEANRTVPSVAASGPN